MTRRGLQREAARASKFGIRRSGTRTRRCACSFWSNGPTSVIPTNRKSSLAFRAANCFPNNIFKTSRFHSRRWMKMLRCRVARPPDNCCGKLIVTIWVGARQVNRASLYSCSHFFSSFVLICIHESFIHAHFLQGDWPSPPQPKTWATLKIKGLSQICRLGLRFDVVPGTIEL